MSKYQAIIFDVDGTAVPNRRGGMPSDRLIETVGRYRDKIHLVAATGRPLVAAMPVIETLGLTTPCIISGGTIILDPATQAILKVTDLPREAVHDIVGLCHGKPYALFLRDEPLGPEIKSGHTRLDENIEIIYIALVPPEDVEELAKALADIPDISSSVVPDWSGNGQFAFNITHINATKEHAVTDVLGRLGVPREASIGVGDADNDLHLFKAVGLKVAMGNGSPALKAAADLVTATVTDDGLAQIIEEYAA